jgi:hypothetical protein
LFSPKRGRRPGPNGPKKELISIQYKSVKAEFSDEKDFGNGLRIPFPTAGGSRSRTSSESSRSSYAWLGGANIGCANQAGQ